MSQQSARIGVFPGSFDPFTHGHFQIVQQALQLFDKVIVAIGESSSKKPMLSDQDRLAALQETFAGEMRVETALFRGLAIDFAQKKGAKFLIRGLRSEADLAFELPMAHTNQSLAPEIQTIFLPTSPDKSFISSTLVREVVKHGGEFGQFVPTAFARRLAVPRS